VNSVPVMLNACAVSVVVTLSPATLTAAEVFIDFSEANAVPAADLARPQKEALAKQLVNGRFHLNEKECASKDDAAPVVWFLATTTQPTTSGTSRALSVVQIRTCATVNPRWGEGRLVLSEGEHVVATDKAMRGRFAKVQQLAQKGPTYVVVAGGETLQGYTSETAILFAVGDDAIRTEQELGRVRTDNCGAAKNGKETVAVFLLRGANPMRLAQKNYGRSCADLEAGKKSFVFESDGPLSND
jgi:hypothetical protein